MRFPGRQSAAFIFISNVIHRSSRINRNNRHAYNPTTTYSTMSLASHSALRSHTWAKSRKAPTPGKAAMLLLHLSMLSLIPLLFDSVHGQSAYGYKRSITTAAQVSPADTVVTEDEVEEGLNSSPEVQQPSLNHEDEYTPLSSSPELTFSSQNLETFHDTPHLDEIRSRVQKAIHSLLFPPSSSSPSSHPRISANSLSQAVTLAQRAIELDVQSSMSPLQTITPSVVALLLRAAQNVFSSDESRNQEEAKKVTRSLNIREHVLKEENLTDPYVQPYIQGLGSVLCEVGEAAVEVPKEALENAFSCGISARDLHLATLGWLLNLQSFSSSPISTLRQSQLKLVLSQLRVLCKALPEHLSLNAGHLSIDRERSYMAAVAAYLSLLRILKQGHLRNVSLHAPILDMMLLLPLPPDLRQMKESLPLSEGCSKKDREARAEGETERNPQAVAQKLAASDRASAMIEGTRRISNGTTQESLFHTRLLTLREAGDQHRVFFAETHQYLIGLLEDSINESSPPPSILFPKRLPAQWVERKQRYKIRYDPGKARWSMDTIFGGEQQSLSPGKLPKEIRDRFLEDPNSLEALLRYAYRHLRNSSIAEKLYTGVIEPQLERLTPIEGQKVSKIENYRTQMANIRFRGACLLRENAVAEEIIQRLLKRALCIQEHNNNSSSEIMAQQLWQPEALFTAKGITNETISATLSFWTATSKFVYIRYWIHQFLLLRKTVYERLRTRTAAAASIQPIEASEIDEDGFVSAEKRLTRWLSNSRILVVLINAACKSGNISLAEKLWLVATEEEKSRGWRLSAEAYTIMLQLYGYEAEKENAIIRNQRRAANWEDSGWWFPREHD